MNPENSYILSKIQEVFNKKSIPLDVIDTKTFSECRKALREGSCDKKLLKYVRQRVFKLLGEKEKTKSEIRCMSFQAEYPWADEAFLEKLYGAFKNSSKIKNIYIEFLGKQRSQGLSLQLEDVMKIFNFSKRERFIEEKFSLFLREIELYYLNEFEMDGHEIGLFLGGKCSGISLKTEYYS